MTAVPLLVVTSTKYKPAGPFTIAYCKVEDGGKTVVSSSNLLQQALPAKSPRNNGPGIVDDFKDVPAKVKRVKKFTSK